MKPEGAFAVPAWWLGGAHLGLVTSVNDPDGMGRVQVQLVGPDADGTALQWARAAVPFAGANRGTFLIPDVGDEVLVLFVGGDPRWPVVVGGLWNGRTPLPEALAGDRVDRWTITGRNGTRVAIVEEASGRETVSIETPGGVSATLTDTAGGSITLEAAGNSVTLDPSGVTIDAGGKITLSAGQIELSAATITVNAGMTQISSVTQVDTLIANSVVSASYTPGTGNVW